MGTFGGGLAVGMSMVQPSGGGGGAIPDVTVATFADLPTTRPDGFLVAVTAQSGVADAIVRWNDGSSLWRLEQCVVATPPPQDGVWFNTGGIYVESADGALVSCKDLLYQWNDSITVAAGAGGGALKYWLPSQVYAGSPEIVAWANGDEDVTTDTQLNAQGWGTIARTAATIATFGADRIRFQTIGSGGLLREAAIKTLTSGVLSTTKCYSAFRVRGTIGNLTLNDSTMLFLGNFFDGANGTFAAWFSGVASRGAFFWTGSSTNLNGAVVDNGAFPNLTSNDELVEIVYNAGVGMASLYRNAVLVATCTRFSSATADQLWIGARGGTTATQIATMDLRFARVMTW